ncbi:MAG: hypothetical protein VYC34_04425, partial [Planctomycetota bacterium]|nr:hypothetical protein [Planctomycetota bacterium]
MLQRRCGVSLVMASAVLMSLAGLAGCGSSSGSKDGPMVNAGLSQFGDETSAPPAPAFDEKAIANRPKSTSDASIENIFEQNAAVLPSLATADLLKRPETPGGDPVGYEPPPDFAAGETFTPNAGLAGFGETESSYAASGAAVSSPRTSEASLRERRERLANELALVLREQARLSETPFREYLALAALEAAMPGVLNGPSAIPTLSPREAEQLTIWRDLLRHVNQGLSDSGKSEVEALGDAVAEASRKMNQWQALMITRMQLCARVEGYGVYTPLPSNKLLARRSHRAIVYVELDNFATRAA